MGLMPNVRRKRKMQVLCFELISWVLHRSRLFDARGDAMRSVSRVPSEAGMQTYKE